MAVTSGPTSDRSARPRLLVLRVIEYQSRLLRRFWRTSVFAYILNPIMYLGAMGFGLGGLVDQHAGTVSGVSYLVFVAPGLLAAGAMQAAAAESMWPVMYGTKWGRTYHGMVSTPIRPADVYGGCGGLDGHARRPGRPRCSWWWLRAARRRAVALGGAGHPGHRAVRRSLRRAAGGLLGRPRRATRRSR